MAVKAVEGKKIRGALPVGVQVPPSAPFINNQNLKRLTAQGWGLP